MFATVEVKDAPVGIKTFFRDLFALPEIELIRVNVPFGEAFYRVVATEYRGQVPVDEICEKLGRLRDSVIFEVNFPCDEKTDSLEFCSDKLLQQLLFNSAAAYIGELDIEPLHSSMTVFDPFGVYAEKINIFAEFFSKIHVFTDNTADYEKSSEHLMENYGMSLIISDRITGKVPDSTVIICPGEVPFCNFYKGILFTNAEDIPPCSCCIRGDGIELPTEYELLRPNGICRMHFASALYEKSNVKSLGSLSFKKLRLT